MSSETEHAANEPTLEALIELTDEVQRAVDAGEWQEAASIEAERRRLLGAYLEHQRRRHGDLEPLRPELDALQRRNNELIGVVHHHQRKLVFEACALNKGRAAVQAYADADE